MIVAVSRQCENGTFELEHLYEFTPSEEYPEFTRLHADLIMTELDVSLQSDLKSMYNIACEDKVFTFARAWL